MVVVRSGLSFPLSGFYENVSELERDADSQLNIAGSNYVVYVFSLDQNLKPFEIIRTDYPAND